MKLKKFEKLVRKLRKYMIEHPEEFQPDEFFSTDMNTWNDYEPVPPKTWEIICHCFAEELMDRYAQKKAEKEEGYISNGHN